MVGIVLASHGDFADGIKMSGSMVFGDQENVASVTLQPSMGPDDFKKKLLDAIATFDDQDEVLFLVDLWGGTPFNQVSAQLSSHEKWAVVTGMNLPMLIEAYTARLSMNTAAEIATHIFVEGRKGVRVQPESLAPKRKGGASAAAAAIPEGTVVGDGKINIVHTRIDSRLLHGQVATTWAKQLKINRIIVVSDNVAHDDLRKTLITQAAPPGVKANVIPVAKLADIYKDPRFGNCSAMLLFENPEDVVRAQELGVAFPQINIGSMAHSEGKTMLNGAVSANQTDIDAFKKLRDTGTTFTIQKVPSDKSEDLWGLIAKAGMDK
ncbi:MAG: PTS sugar transporter subunit IIB [Atopobiaceae bacterium]|jgi:PTS system mannose-specific IIB component|nr:PTS sugar transporter subunit IIB [Atopobiaceae bacterium]MCH4180451.1 PTS sugar transporter subunit IIB [Atopobiaceae bacterium]MCH4214594.1 PTS sugar transporter subunit IIB [Atopobiaceae bacterium]MCH4275811.1 PTS sugar transporter subunit IIB [Atopobiaceae bacterium]MCI1225825.1 PTS sugar transporter subunit IIB [Atopobiaceae bacterium]